MRSITIALALALAPAMATAQHDHPATRAPGAHAAMKSPCPLHLKTLQLTPTQDSALRAIRTAHMAEMQAVRERLGLPAMVHGDSAAHAAHAARPKPSAEVTTALRDAMRASMARALDALRASLTPAQRVTLEDAVKAHDAERAARRDTAAGHQCECCG